MERNKQGQFLTGPARNQESFALSLRNVCLVCTLGFWCILFLFISYNLSLAPRLNSFLLDLVLSQVCGGGNLAKKAQGKKPEDDIEPQ
jgi:hypothetical protein